MSWLGFGSSLWLAGLAALALPVVIHLLSRGRQRRLAIGSVRWLEAAETLRASRLRPSRWWLLALRCLLIALVVLTLAAPRLGVGQGSESADWLLLAPEVVADRERLEPNNPAAYEALDQALNEGREVRWLLPGLPVADLEDPGASVPGLDAVSLWSLLVEADQAAPPELAWIVVASVTDATLGGARPTLARDIDWQPVVDGTENRWLARARVGSDERIAVTIGISDQGSSRFESLVFAPREGAPTELTVAEAGDGWNLTLSDGGGMSQDDALQVPKVGKALAAVIFYDADRAADVTYVRAGLEAAAEAATLVLTLRQEALGEAVVTHAEERLIFWLAAEPVAQQLLDAVADGATLVSDALERFENCDSTFWLPASFRPLRVDLCGSVEAGTAPAPAILWASSQGRPLLVGESLRAGTWLRFASRWSPGWTDLVLAPEFPTWLLSLVESKSEGAVSSRISSSDRRFTGELASPRQAPGERSEDSPREVPLAASLWMAVFVLAAGERWLALRGRR